MTERIKQFYKDEADELVKGGLDPSMKRFGLNTFLNQISMAQIAGITKPEEGLTVEEADSLRTYIKDLSEKL